MYVVVRRGMIALLLLLGLWQLGSGSYIFAKAQVAQWLLQQAWQQTQANQYGVKSAVKPWSWADTWPVARLLVNQHNIDLLVLQGSSGRTLAFGPGHMVNTPLPGEVGNSVIGGHRDTHFKFLQQLNIGDVLTIELANKQQIHYRVESFSVVDHNDTQAVLSQAKQALTLVTCYPFDALVAGGPLRYVVVARPLPSFLYPV